MLEKFQVAISPQPIRINWRWRPPPSWGNFDGHISATAHIYLYIADRAVIFAIAQLSCLELWLITVNVRWNNDRYSVCLRTLSEKAYGKLTVYVLVLCDTWNWSDDNDTVSGIAILDTTAIPEMCYTISMFFRNRQSYTLVVTEMCVCSSVCTLTRL